MCENIPGDAAPPLAASSPPSKKALPGSKDPSLPSLTVTIAGNDPEGNEPGKVGSATAGDGISKLKVPTPLLVADNTPTPVRHLLREVEANLGLVVNPFDEHFRKAAQARREESGGGPSSSSSVAPKDLVAQSTRDATQETLNTPQIFPLVDEQQPAAPADFSVAAPVENRTQVKHLSGGCLLKPIAPFPPPSRSQTVLLGQAGSARGATQAKQAKLLLQLPDSKQQVVLSDIPVQTVLPPPLASPPAVLPPPAASRPHKRQPEGGVEEEPFQTDKKRLELLERNRAAAHRSRQKRKRKTEETETRLRQTAAAARNLATENALLREEVARLKAALAAHSDCDVTRRLGLGDAIREETRAKAFAYRSDVAPQQVRLVVAPAGNLLPLAPKAKPQHPPGTQSLREPGVSALLTSGESATVSSSRQEDILSLATRELSRMHSLERHHQLDGGSTPISSRSAHQETPNFTSSKQCEKQSVSAAAGGSRRKRVKLDKERTKE